MVSTPLTPFLSKTLGALLGVHTGDSLGATLEFRSWDSIKKEYPSGLQEIVGGGAFSWPAGAATDDTDLTRAVLLAYQDSTANSQQNQYRDAEGKTQTEFDVVKKAADYSLQWMTGPWEGRQHGDWPADIGHATMLGLQKYQSTKDPRKSGAGNGKAGNGSLMRCVSTALFTANKEKRSKESVEISAITHNDVRCTVSCAAYNEIIAALVGGKTVQEAVEAGKAMAEGLDCPAVVKAIECGESMSIRDKAEKGPGKDLPDATSGFVLQSLTVAIAALVDSRSFEETIVDVVRIGGDTDTNGAIAGGLLGARDGIERIPERWLQTLQFRKEFEDVATHILLTQGRV